VKVVVLKDTLGPKLAGMLGRLKARSGLMMAIGEQVRAFARDAFTDPAKRVTPWPAKKDGSPATLRKSGALIGSPRLAAVTTDSVTVVSDRPYSAIHQLGGKTKPHVIKSKDKAALAFNIQGKAYLAKQVNHPGSVIPARPYFPIDTQGRLHPDMEADVAAMIRRHLGLGRD
jgi:phage gpG-like protein